MLTRKLSILAAMLAMLLVMSPVFGQSQESAYQVLYLAYPDDIPTFMASNPDGSQTRVLGAAVFEPNAEITSIALSPDQTRIALSSRRDRTGDEYGINEIIIFDVQSGDFHYLTNDLRNNVLPAWSPDSRRIAYLRGGGHNGYGEVVIVDLETHQTRVLSTDLRTLVQSDFGMSFRGVSWSSDGTMLILTGITSLPNANNPVVIVNTDGTSPQLGVPLDARVGSEIARSPIDPNIIYGGCSLGDQPSELCEINISNMQLSTLTDLATYLPDFGNPSIFAIATIPTGEVIFQYGIRDVLIYTYDPIKDTLTSTAAGESLMLIGSIPSTFKISPIVGEANVLPGDLPPPQQPWTVFSEFESWHLSRYEIYDMGWNASGDLLGVATINGLQVLNTALYQIGQVRSGSLIRALSWSPDSNQLAIAIDTKIEIWHRNDNSDGFTLERTLVSNLPVYGVFWSPDGSRIASIEVNEVDFIWLGQVRVWDTTSWASTAFFETNYSLGADFYISQRFAWASDGSPYIAGVGTYARLENAVFVAATPASIYVLNVVSGEQSFTPLLVEDIATSVSWQPGGNLIAVGTRHGTQLYDLDSGGYVHTVGLPFQTLTVKWDPSGGYVIDGNAVARAENGVLLGQLWATPISGRIAVWNPNGQIVTIADFNNVIINWDVGELLD
jgi:WD40 repeat protein